MSIDSYYIGFYLDSAGKKCGKGWISADKKCKSSGSTSIKQARAPKLPDENNNLPIAVGATLGIGAIAGAAIAINTANKKTQKYLNKSKKRTYTPYRNQTYDKIFPSDSELQSAKFQSFGDVPSSASKGDQNGTHKRYKVEVKGKKFFVKSAGGWGRDINSLSASKEVLAYDGGKILGIDKYMLPAKKFTKKGKFFVTMPLLDKSEVKDFGTPTAIKAAVSKLTDKQKADFLLFDYVFDNYSRHYGNIMFRSNGEPLLIDHGSIRTDVQIPGRKKRDFTARRMDAKNNVIFTSGYAGNKSQELPIESLKNVLSNRATIRKTMQYRYAGQRADYVDSITKKMEKRFDNIESMIKRNDTRIRNIVK